jgi:hypothetical protein
LKPAESPGIIGGMSLKTLFLCVLTIAALGGCAGQSGQVDDRILVKAVNVSKSQITFAFKRTGQVRTYYVDGLTEIAIKDGPGRLREINAGEEVFAYHLRSSDTLDSLIVGYSDPLDAF